jgi:phospholipid-binding lipoprotein MlaA
MMPSFATHKTLSGAALVLVLSGCASHGDPRDPLEPMNRAIYHFNETVDKAVMKPVAEGYRAAVPKPVQTGVRNFFSNLNDVTVLANDALQLKAEYAGRDLLRITINTSFGLLGLLDVAQDMGLKKRNKDFGQTLGYWGTSSGPYLVLPFYGPSSVRDAAGRVVDSLYFDPVQNPEVFPQRTVPVVLDVIDTRVERLKVKDALDSAALDPYEFTRDVFLERRTSLIHEGHPPADKE